jgi:hypothetical protein
LAEYVHGNLLFSHPHLYSFQSHGEAQAGEERIQIERPPEGVQVAYLGQRRTPSSERRDSGGLRSTLMPSFSVAIASADARSTANRRPALGFWDAEKLKWPVARSWTGVATIGLAISSTSIESQAARCYTHLGFRPVVKRVERKVPEAEAISGPGFSWVAEAGEYGKSRPTRCLSVPQWS